MFKAEERWLEMVIIEVYKIKDYLGKVNKKQRFPLSSKIRSKHTKWNYQATGLKQKEVLFHTLNNEIVEYITQDACKAKTIHEFKKKLYKLTEKRSMTG